MLTDFSKTVKMTYKKPKASTTKKRAKIRAKIIFTIEQKIEILREFSKQRKTIIQFTLDNKLPKNSLDRFIREFKDGKLGDNTDLIDALTKRKSQFTPDQKIEMLWKFAKQHKTIKNYSLENNLLTGIISRLTRQLKIGKLGYQKDLIKSLAEKWNRKTDKIEQLENQIDQLKNQITENAIMHVLEIRKMNKLINK